MRDTALISVRLPCSVLAQLSAIGIADKRSRSSVISNLLQNVLGNPPGWVVDAQRRFEKGAEHEQK